MKIQDFNRSYNFVSSLAILGIVVAFGWIWANRIFSDTAISHWTGFIAGTVIAVVSYALRTLLDLGEAIRNDVQVVGNFLAAEATRASSTASAPSSATVIPADDEYTRAKNALLARYKNTKAP